MTFILLLFHVLTIAENNFAMGGCHQLMGSLSQMTLALCHWMGGAGMTSDHSADILGVCVCVCGLGIRPPGCVCEYSGFAAWGSGSISRVAAEEAVPASCSRWAPGTCSDWMSWLQFLDHRLLSRSRLSDARTLMQAPGGAASARLSPERRRDLSSQAGRAEGVGGHGSLPSPPPRQATGPAGCGSSWLPETPWGWERDF